MMAHARTTTARGLGWQHQQHRDRMIRRHADGSACWWCDLPMWRDPGLNWDGRVLAADHTHARAHGGRRADRLLHGRCNSQRGDGRHDSKRPAAQQTHPSKWSSRDDKAVEEHLVMPW